MSTSKDGPWFNKQVGMAVSPCTDKRKMLKRAEIGPKGRGEGKDIDLNSGEKKSRGDHRECSFAHSDDYNE